MARPLRRVLAALAGALLLASVTACSGGGDDGGSSTTTASERSTTTTEVPLGHGQQVDPTTYIPAIGDCFDRRIPDPEKPFTEIILVLPCGEPHSYEVFDLWRPEAEGDPDSTTGEVPYPDEEELHDEARNICVAALEDFVGIRYELSRLEVDVILPSPESWAAGNRSVGCLAFDRDGELLEGSQRGAEV